MVDIFRKLSGVFGGMSTGARIGLIVGLTLVGTAMAMGAIVLLPVDHFQPRVSDVSGWRRHGVLVWALRIARNIVGWLLLPMGVVMALPLVPGPGLVFILIGLSLVDFPGKKGLEKKLLGRPQVLRFINEVRTQFGKPPLELG